MRQRSGVVIGGSAQQTQTHRRKKRKHKTAPSSLNNHVLHAPRESANSNSNSINGYSDDFEVNSSASQVHAAVVCEEIPGTEQTQQSKASIGGEGFSFAELRQRSVNGGASFAVSAVDDKEVNSVDVENPSKDFGESGGGVVRSDTLESLELKRVLLAEDSNLEKSPLTYYLEELYNGNSLRSTTTLGNEKGRERVYDTIFRLPWRCELVFAYRCWLLCLLQFFSVIIDGHANKDHGDHLETSKDKEVQEPSTVELLDFGCFLIMVCGVTLLQQIDISLIYHMIRGQSTIKLYVIYNVLEIFDKLCQSFNGDVLQMLFHSVEGLARCHPEMESTRFWIWRFISDQVLAIVTSNCSFLYLVSSGNHFIGCMVAHNNALPALLVSNNFAEIKSYVFKGYNKDNVRSLVYFDSIERFHISAFILFVLAQNILEAEGPWFGSFLINILLVYLCEMAIDIIKHSFIAKFNNIKPIAFSEFLEALCKQTLNMETEDAKKNLTFVPLAPACVVIRVLTPIYAANLPYNPLPWRLFWILLFSAMTCIMLTSLKVLIGMILQKHATWYVNRCQRRKHHLHED